MDGLFDWFVDGLVDGGWWMDGWMVSLIYINIPSLSIDLIIAFAAFLCCSCCCAFIILTSLLLTAHFALYSVHYYSSSYYSSSSFATVITVDYPLSRWHHTRKAALLSSIDRTFLLTSRMDHSLSWFVIRPTRCWRARTTLLTRYQLLTWLPTYIIATLVCLHLHVHFCYIIISKNSSVYLTPYVRFSMSVAAAVDCRLTNITPSHISHSNSHIVIVDTM